MCGNGEDQTKNAKESNHPAERMFWFLLGAGFSFLLFFLQSVFNRKKKTSRDIKKGTSLPMSRELNIRYLEEKGENKLTLPDLPLLLSQQASFCVYSCPSAVCAFWKRGREGRGRGGGRTAFESHRFDSIRVPLPPSPPPPLAQSNSLYTYLRIPIRSIPNPIHYINSHQITSRHITSHHVTISQPPLALSIRARRAV